MADPADHTLPMGKGFDPNTLLLLIIARALVQDMAASAIKTKLIALLTTVYDRYIEG